MAWYPISSGFRSKTDGTLVNEADGINVDGSRNVAMAGSNPTQQTATIATGATGLSAAVDLAGKTLLGYIMPATWVAAGLTFQTSPDGVTYNDLYDNTGTEISHTVSTSRFVRVNPADWVGVRFLKLRSGTGAVPVNQTASRDIILVTKAV